MLSKIVLWYVLNVAPCAGIALWKASQLVRSPQRRSLRWVVACFGIGALGWAIEPFTGAGVAWGRPAVVGPAWAIWWNTTFPLMMGYCLACVFVFSAERGRVPWSWAMRQAVVLAVALVTLAVIASEVSPMSATGTHPAYSLTALELFTLVAKTYAAYALVICTVWMRRYARLTARWLAWGLTAASVGVAVNCVSATRDAVAMVLRLTGTAIPAWLAMPPLVFMASNLLFIVGIVAPGAAVRWSAARIWWRHLCDYHRLRPLWSLLHQAFPDDALNRVPVSLWPDVLSLRSVNRRFYRRVIECRDGLVRVSGLLSAHDGPIGRMAFAAWLRQELESGVHIADDGSQGLVPRPVAIPSGDGLDADVRELVALARALRVPAV